MPVLPSPGSAAGRSDETGAVPDRPAPSSIVLLAVLLVATAGCAGDGRSRAPIPDSTLVDVLVDLHLLEARMEVAPPDSAPTAPSREEIFRRHGIDSARFARTVDRYAERLDAYSRLYDRVTDRLQARRPRGTNGPSP